jgi:hypothetical protein
MFRPFLALYRALEGSRNQEEHLRLERLIGAQEGLIDKLIFDIYGISLSDAVVIAEEMSRIALPKR